MQAANVKKEFGAEVKRRRIELGFSQEKLAELSDLHRTYISDVEAGKRNPSLASIQRLALALGATLGTVFNSVENIPGFEDGLKCRQNDHHLSQILLIEDDPRDVELTMAAFQRAKLSNPVQVMHDGIQALDFLFGVEKQTRGVEQPKPKVILLDLQLPRIHGLEVLRRLKSDERTKNLPVVVLTGSQRDEHIREAMDLGAAAYIVKPVDFQNFSQITSRLSFRWALLAPGERAAG